MLLLGARKAEAILSKLAISPLVSTHDILITADQVVTHDGKILEKPIDREEAISFLRSYSSKHCATVGSIVLTDLRNGRRVQVIKNCLTCYLICRTNYFFNCHNPHQAVDTSTIYFKSIPEEVINSLIEQGDVFYCAGALMVENPILVPYVDRIEGSIDSVMGMSKSLLEKLMNDIHINQSA